jgi:hypothetical protein
VEVEEERAADICEARLAWRGVETGEVEGGVRRRNGMD